MERRNERFGTLIVGTDASPESSDAIAWARAIAGEGDRIVVLHAWQLPVVTGYDMVVTVDPHEIEQAAKDSLAAQADELDDPRLIPVVHQGHVGRALVAEANEREAAMIVVGHRGDSRVSLMLGSTANYVLHHTRRPVVVVRGERTPPHAAPPRTVVVGVDAHELDGRDNESVRAVRFAYDLPGVERVRVVHAWFLPALAVGMFADVSADLGAMDAAAQAVVDHIVEVAGPPPAGVQVVAEPIRGTPEFGLISESSGADLVVVGSRGRGGFSGLVLGSTSAAVVAHSHAPVVVVR
jgi:nucleotide-binding universal stress UspA family protein